MKQFRVRVDCEGDERLVAFCKKHSEVFVLVHHTTTTENPHYHFYIETHMSQGNFSNKIKDELSVTGSNYSNAVCDPDRKLEYLSYLFNTKKGNVARLVTYQGFSPLDVATFQETALNIAKEFKAKLKAKATQYDVAMLVLERLDERQAHLPEVVYDVVVSVLKESRTMARPNHVKDIIATVMAFSNNKKAKQQIKELTLKFFSTQ